MGAGADAVDGEEYRAVIEGLLDDPSYFKMTVNAFDLSAPTGSIDLDIEVMEGGLDISRTFFRMSITESGLTYSGRPHDDVNRYMPVDQPITVNQVGQVQNIQLTFPMDPAWVEANLRIVAFVQDDSDHQVLASASSDPIPAYALGYYALGERQVVGPAGGRFAYEPFRVYNTGTTADNYAVTLIAQLPAGWDASLTDGVTAYGTSHSEFLNPGEYFELYVDLAATSPGFGSVAVEMTQDNWPHPFPRSLSYGYITDNVDVLLVDDDGPEAFEDYFAAALETCGRSYGIWNRNVSAPTAEVLGEFPLIVWSCGWTFPTVDEGDRTALASYLDAGGSLFITGQDIGWDMNDQGGAAYQWYRNYLHATFINDDTNDYTLSGVPGDPISNGLDITIQGGDGANNQQYPSDIDPADGSATVIWTYDATRNGAIRAETGVYRVVYLAFGYEAINNATHRAEVLGRSLNWLQHGGADVEPAPPVLRPFFSSAPNPVTDLATLRFTLPSAGAVSLKVYGPDGRLVQTLVDASLDAGTHVVDWNRTDREGQRLPAGVYCYRLEGADVNLTSKTVLLR